MIHLRASELTDSALRRTFSRAASHSSAAILIASLLSLLLLAACGRSTIEGGVTPIPAATTATLAGSRVVSGPQLQWQQMPAPPGLILHGALWSIAPGDGEVAYTYVPPSQGSAAAHSYVTHDHGATWSQGGDIAVGAQPASPDPGKSFMLDGALVVDAANPATAVATAAWVPEGASGDVSLISDFATFDSGAHWQKLAGHADFSQLATYQAHIYAQRMAGDAAAQGHALFVSADHMATWQPIDAGIPALAQGFWLNPNSGALLTETNGGGTTSDQFYTSTDGGSHWSQLPAPQLDNAKGQQQQWAVAAPQSGQPWQICAGYAAITVAHPNTLACSTDGGQTWATRPALNVVAHSPKGFDFYAPTFLLAIAADGAVLSTVGGASSDVYRLRAGESVWQDLGPLPPAPGNLAYFPTVSGGVLWTASQPGPQVAAYPGH